MATTIMSARGQVVIPAEIRGELGLKRGTRFRVISPPGGGQVVLEVLPEGDWRALQGLLAGEQLTDWLEEERRKEREREG